MKNKKDEQQPVEQPKAIEIPFTVALHYTPGRGVMVIPIGVNLPGETIMQMLDMARTEIIKAQLKQMTQVPPIVPVEDVVKK